MVESSLYRFLALMAGLLVMTILRRQQISEDLREENNEESQMNVSRFHEKKVRGFWRNSTKFRLEKNNEPLMKKPK